jgi:hypothetical protein
MKITKDFTRKDGIRTVTVQLARFEQLKAFDDNCFYELGDPLDMIVTGHFINNSQRVYWCSIAQEWTEA